MAAELPLIMKGTPLNPKRMVSGADFVALGVGGTGVDLSTTGGATHVLAQDASHVVSARALIAADIPSLAASIITSGTLSVTVGGTGANLSATGGANQIVRQDTLGGAFTVSVLAAADIPNLAASIITSGQLALARGGTGADLSATGGANQIVRQNSLGGVFTVSVLTAGDIPNLDASKITSGTFATARLGSGSPTASTYVDGATGAWTALPTAPNVLTLTNGEASAFIVGNVVYSSAAGTVKMAKADALATSEVIGLSLTATSAAGSATIQTGDTVTLTTGQWDAIAGTSGGLGFGVVYYLSAATAGLLTSTAPSTTGQQWVQIGIGLSTTQMKIQILGPIGV